MDKAVVFNTDELGTSVANFVTFVHILFDYFVSIFNEI